MASPDYLKKHGLPETLNDLKLHQLLQYHLSSSSAWKLTDKQGVQHFIHVAGKKANNDDFLKDMAITGHEIHNDAHLSPGWQLLWESWCLYYLNTTYLNSMPMRLIRSPGIYPKKFEC